jgi:hypothetical protein
MSKLGDLLAEIAEEEGLDADDLASVIDEVRAKRKTALARTEAAGEIEAIPKGHERGVAMYGHESKREAYTRWLEQEQADPEGIYGPGGATAGGIFGNAPIAMPDYDPSAHRISEHRQGNATNVKLAQVLDRVLERMDRLESGGGPPPRQLEAPPERRPGALSRLLKGRKGGR